MPGKIISVGTAIVFAISIAATAHATQLQAGLSATEIVNRNVAARGGLKAWRAVQAMTWTGKLGVGGSQRATLPVAVPGKREATLPTDPRPKVEPQLPFVKEMQRPHKDRVEILFKGKTAVQVYDGTQGWKLRPYLNRMDVEPYTADELKLAAMQSELDGPLMDAAAKGTRIELVGMEKLDDRDTYKLKLTMKDGRAIHVWINAQTFLEVKTEVQPRRLDGIEHPVEVYYSDYRTVGGLQIPFILETKVLPVASKAPNSRVINIPVERIEIEKVDINPTLDAKLFAKPQAEAR